MLDGLSRSTDRIMRWLRAAAIVAAATVVVLAAMVANPGPLLDRRPG